MANQKLNNEKTFPTPNSALAAWLWSQGFEPIQFIITQHPGLTVFENSDALKQCRRLWEVGKAEGNCNTFYSRYRTILERLAASRVWKHP